MGKHVTKRMHSLKEKIRDKDQYFSQNPPTPHKHTILKIDGILFEMVSFKKGVDDKSRP